MNNTPKIFISSTIYDFKDLRSALKFYLEQLGYIVYTSENNDFKVDGSVHSYDACLKLIEECDYFILLIGGRVGGWYNKENKVSITRQEYRTAYKLHKQGKLEIISFVRSDVWQLKESRNELAKHLHNLNFLEKETKESVLNFPTKFANDAEFVSDFIMEVGRNAETNKALKENGELPTGNWIRQFNSFRDIIDALSSLIKLGNLDRKFSTELLRIELENFFNGLARPIKENMFLMHNILTDLLDLINPPNDLNDNIVIPSDKWENFINTFFLINCSMTSIPIDINIINQILTSKSFFYFDNQHNAFFKSSIYNAILELKEKILFFQSTQMDLVVTMDLLEKIKHTKKVDTYYMSVSDFSKFLFVAGTYSNIVLLVNAIKNALPHSDKYIQPNLFDCTILFKNISYESVDF